MVKKSLSVKVSIKIAPCKALQFGERAEVEGEVIHHLPTFTFPPKGVSR
jgi:hypothetical protein